MLSLRNLCLASVTEAHVSQEQNVFSRAMSMFHHTEFPNCLPSKLLSVLMHLVLALPWTPFPMPAESRPRLSLLGVSTAFGTYPRNSGLLQYNPTNLSWAIKERAKSQALGSNNEFVSSVAPKEAVTPMPHQSTSTGKVKCNLHKRYTKRKEVKPGWRSQGSRHWGRWHEHSLDE